MSAIQHSFPLILTLFHAIRFDIIRKLGQGTYGKVQLAVNKDTGQEVGTGNKKPLTTG